MDTPRRPAVQAAVNRPVAGAESKALLSQCRDLARSKLSGIIAEALEKVENDLFAAAEASTSRAERSSSVRFTACFTGPKKTCL